jgi:hypothetical protein
MVERGARHLVFISRTGVTSPAATEHVKRLKGIGVQVTVIEGDVSVLEDVERTVKSIELPIAGVIHAAIHLDVRDLAISLVAKIDFCQESLFDDMTLAQWHAGLEAKVRGAWNLHQTLITTSLDFFLMTSSVARTVGLATETNY